MYPKPKKHLGQNFLSDKNIQNKIIRNLNLSKNDCVLEIGPGTGALTFQIANKTKKVVAVEIDKELCQMLREKMKDYGNIELINEDILKFNFSKYFKSKQKIRVIGNIPYYISSPIIEYLFEHVDRIDCIFLTLQKEFAKRLVASANSKDYSSFSCFVQYFTEPEVLFIIKKVSFYPIPKVDSAFVKMQVRARPPVDVKDRDLLFKIIRKAFGQRRKMLRNSLKGLIPPEKIPQNLRPENLTLSDFAKLIT